MATLWRLQIALITEGWRRTSSGYKKLDKWADLLLDTGKRNNLINFKDTRTSTVEVLLPSSDVLFEKVDGTASFEAFDPKIVEEDDDLEESYAPEQLQIGTPEESSEPEQLQIEMSEKSDAFWRQSRIFGSIFR